MSSMYGENLKISIFGQSHSSVIGVTIDGLLPGFKIDMDELQAFLNRRAPGQNAYSTKRREADTPEFLSGLVDGFTCGAPLMAVIRNSDTHSEDYENLRDVPRPSHADYTAQMKYHGFQDVSGGGHFSGRLTAPLCIAGGIYMQMLRNEGIEIAAHIANVGQIKDMPFDWTNVNRADFDKLKGKAFAVNDDDCGEKMLSLIKSAKEMGDSVGGSIECAVIGLPAGLGEPMFDGMDSRIAAIVFGIPAIKGIEFGNGFGCASLFGSQNNDSFYMDGDIVKTKTNNHGGILGGITSGMPLVFRAAVKPTPSIALVQQSISLSKKENTQLQIKGRHDPCIVPRAVPCVEAAAAIAVYDALLNDKKTK